MRTFSPTVMKGASLNRSKRFARSIVASVITTAICTMIGTLPIRSAARENPAPAIVQGRADTSAHNVYLPLALRARTPLGFVTTPAQLAAAKAQADRGAQPSADAVESLLKNADEALADAP